MQCRSFDACLCCPPGSTLTQTLRNRVREKGRRLMAPPLSSSLPQSSSRRSVRSTFVSHLGVQPGDHSYLLVRERAAATSAGEYFALHGAFDLAAVERLSCSLRGQASLPLVLDLRGVSALDEAFLARLLKLRRELSGSRPVSFQIADDSQVSALICRLGLEERFGLAPARLPLRRTAAPINAPAQKPSREFAAR